MFTIACADVDWDRSVLITKGPAGLMSFGRALLSTSSRYSISAFLTSSFSGILRPDLPLLAESSRQISQPIWPWESLVIHHVSFAISFALSPALADSRKMSRFLFACRVVER